MIPHLTLCFYQAREILEARGRSDCETSPDLGMSRVRVRLSEEGAQFPNGVFIHWDEIDEIAGCRTKCFQVTDEGIAEIQKFSATTNRMRTLYPTAGAPTTMISGVLMHRIKAVDPMEDSRRKIEAISPVAGKVLDTATGLGYTALLAAKRAALVVTVEIDPVAHEIIRANPWSAGVLDLANVMPILGDIRDVVSTFATNEFARIIHDPPTMAVAGDLYSRAFYEQLFRVLSYKGRLFHYVGDPNSAHGRKITPGVMRRLHEAGFTKVERAPSAFGVLAYKLGSFRR